MVNIQYIDFPNDYVVYTNNNVLGGIVILEIYFDYTLTGKIYLDNNKYYLVNYTLNDYLTNCSLIDKLEEINNYKYPNLKPITLKEWFSLLVVKKENLIKN
jgi:hypothetical protein